MQGAGAEVPGEHAGRHVGNRIVWRQEGRVMKAWRVGGARPDADEHHEGGIAGAIVGEVVGAAGAQGLSDVQARGAQLRLDDGGQLSVVA